MPVKYMMMPARKVTEVTKERENLMMCLMSIKKQHGSDCSGP